MNQSKVKYSLSNWDLVSVNPNYKTWNWKDLFCFWGVNVQSLIGFSLIASLYLMYNCTFLVFFFGQNLAYFFVNFFSNKFEKPFQKFVYLFEFFYAPPLVFMVLIYFDLLGVL